MNYEILTFFRNIHQEFSTSERRGYKICKYGFFVPFEKLFLLIIWLDYEPEPQFFFFNVAGAI
jgi:hypothetical protein